MRSRVGLLSSVAMMALLATAQIPESALREAKRRPQPKSRRRIQESAGDPLAAERAAHNAAVDARKAEKRARKHGRRAA